MMKGKFKDISKIKDIDDYRSVKTSIIGAGELGANVGNNLAFLGYGKIIIFDPETTAPNGLYRSFYYEYGYGRHKVETLADKLKKINCDAKIIGFRSPFFPPLIHQECDLIFDCTDYNLSNYEVMTYSKENKVPLIQCKIGEGKVGSLDGRIIISDPNSEHYLELDDVLKEEIYSEELKDVITSIDHTHSPLLIQKLANMIVEKAREVLFPDKYKNENFNNNLIVNNVLIRYV